MDDFHNFLINDLESHLINSKSEEEMSFKMHIRDQILLIYDILLRNNKLENVFNDPERYLNHLESDKSLINNESNKLKFRLLKIFYKKIIQFKNRQNSSRKSIKK